MHPHRTNLDKIICVTRALTENPGRSNVSIAHDAGVSEFVVRRYRKVLEASSILSIEPVREGMDGRYYNIVGEARMTAPSLAIVPAPEPKQAPVNPALDKISLAMHEAAIDRGLNAFVEVGQALAS